MSTIYGDPIIISSMEGGTAVFVQNTKALTITSNGTVSVTPDAPYDALKKVDVTVNVASGGGSGEVSSGYSVTFPATTNNWDKNTNYAMLVLSDGSTVDFTDYSVVAGRTINNVIDIQSSGDPYYVLRLTLTAGSVVVTRTAGAGAFLYTYRIEAPGTTPATYASSSMYYSFLPMEDIIISAIGTEYTYE